MGELSKAHPLTASSAAIELFIPCWNQSKPRFREVVPVGYIQRRIMPPLCSTIYDDGVNCPFDRASARVKMRNFFFTVRPDKGIFGDIVEADIFVAGRIATPQ